VSSRGTKHPPNRELVCPNGSRKSADPQNRTRIREHPPSNQSLTSACQGFCRNLSRSRNGSRGSRSVTTAFDQVAMTMAQGRHPSSKLQSPGFQKPAPIEHFYRFSCRAVFSWSGRLQAVSGPVLPRRPPGCGSGAVFAGVQ
jgi:hypothetical protein